MDRCESDYAVPFPVDDQTLQLLWDAVAGSSPDAHVRRRDGATSLWAVCQLYSELAGFPSGVSYHHNDVIMALVAEVRRLRASHQADADVNG